MKFYWNTNAYGWRMWGVTGNGGRWFVGFSKAPEAQR